MKVDDKVRVKVPENEKEIPILLRGISPGWTFEGKIVDGPDEDGDLWVIYDGQEWCVSPEWCELLSPVGAEVTRVSTCKVQLTVLQIAQLLSEKAERATLTHLTDGSGRVEVTWYES